MSETVFSGAEGENLIVAPQASGRPQTISYTWTKDRAPLIAGPRLLIEGPMLNFTKLNRSDAGIYTCEAVNSEGASIITLTISVQCKYDILYTEHLNYSNTVLSNCKDLL